MTFAWPDYLDLAEKLADGTTEAELRSAVSRAYYAVYGFARDSYPNEHRYSQSEGSHQALVRFFQDSPLARMKNTGMRFERLRAECTRADYDARAVFTPSATRNHVRSARFLLGDITRA